MAVMMIPAASAGDDTAWSFDVMQWELTKHYRSGRLRSVVLPEASVRATLDTRGQRDSTAKVAHLTGDGGRLWIESPNRTIAALDPRKARTTGRFSRPTANFSV
jgi:hypothetical protein